MAGGSAEATAAVPPIDLAMRNRFNTPAAGPRRRSTSALTQPHQIDRGKAMLKAVGFERFDPATTSIYKGQAELLQQYWGY